MPCQARALAAVMLVLASAASPARADWMHSGWEGIAMSQPECIAHAATQAAELGYVPSPGQSSVFAWRGEDGVTVRCIAERGLVVIFAFTHDSDEEGRETVDRIRAGFRAVANR